MAMNPGPPMMPPQGAGDADDAKPDMPVEQAQQILAKFNIGPKDLPLVAQAADVMMDAQGGSESAPPDRSQLDQAIDAATAQHASPGGV